MIEGNNFIISLKQSFCQSGVGLENRHQGLECEERFFEKAKQFKYLGTIIFDSDNIRIAVVKKVGVNGREEGNAYFYTICKLLISKQLSRCTV